MKKIYILISSIIIIIILTIICYFLLRADQKIPKQEDYFITETNIEKEITSYGYTLDNPNIKVNPFGSSPLTALVSFETKEEEPITITIHDPSGHPTLTNTFKKSTTHYIPIYGLYANYDNQVTIKTSNESHTITIKTPEIPHINITSDATPEPGKFTFISDGTNTYAYDENKDIRWYLSNYHYQSQITALSNNHLLVASNRLDTNNTPISLLEIDLLGRIYYEYQIPSGYNGLSTIKSSQDSQDNHIFLLSNHNIIELDHQTGFLLNKYPIPSSSWQYLTIDNNNLLLCNEETTLSLNLETKDTESLPPQSYPHYQNLSIYNDEQYRFVKPVRFGHLSKTKPQIKNITTLFSKSPDNKYQQYHIKLTQEFDRLVITGDFPSKNSYLILDQFLGKKTYKITSNPYYVNQEGLKGRYSIYLKIDNQVYNTNTYIKF